MGFEFALSSSLQASRTRHPSPPAEAPQRTSTPEGPRIAVLNRKSRVRQALLFFLVAIPQCRILSKVREAVLPSAVYRFGMRMQWFLLTPPGARISGDRSRWCLQLLTAHSGSMFGSEWTSRCEYPAAGVVVTSFTTWIWCIFLGRILVSVVVPCVSSISVPSLNDGFDKSRQRIPRRPLLHCTVCSARSSSASVHRSSRRSPS